MDEEEASQFPLREPIQAPHYTQVPNVVIDEWLPDLSGAELKALLYILRRTFGFGKEKDPISLNQMLDGLVTGSGERLDRGTGLSRSTLVASLKSLEEKAVIIVETRTHPTKGNLPTIYHLNVEHPLVRKSNYPRPEIVPGVVRKSNPQKKDLQKKDSSRRGGGTQPPDYAAGPYGVCPECGMKPHDPTCPRAAEDAS